MTLRKLFSILTESPDYVAPNCISFTKYWWKALFNWGLAKSHSIQSKLIPYPNVTHLSIICRCWAEQLLFVITRRFCNPVSVFRFWWFGLRGEEIGTAFCARLISLVYLKQTTTKWIKKNTQFEIFVKLSRINDVLTTVLKSNSTTKKVNPK